MLEKHFITIFLIVGFSMYLWRQRRSEEKEYRIHWMTIVSTIILIVADCFVVWAQGDPARQAWRLFFSVVGYVIRPAAALGITLIIFPKERKPRYLAIPFFFNLLVYCTAFFTSSIAFGFDENYELVRGPLGLTVYSVCFFYMVFCLLTTWDRFRREPRTGERLILYICALSCVIAALIDGDTDGDHVNAAIMVSSIFLYMFMRFFGANRDPLTGLLNRLSFYEDCELYSTAVSAVASLDMNGLKKLNDTQGHAAGDRALTEIGRCINEACDHNTIGYRVGGDEFVVLFLHRDEEAVEKTVKAIKDGVAGAGYSVSTGYAMKEKDSSMEDALQASDQNMYRDKADYYQQTGRDRRSRPRT